MKSVAMDNTGAAWRNGGRTGLCGPAALEHRRGMAEWNRVYLVFQGSPTPPQVVIAHMESKVISNFGYMVISGVLFD